MFEKSKFMVIFPTDRCEETINYFYSIGVFPITMNWAKGMAECLLGEADIRKLVNGGFTIVNCSTDGLYI